MLKLAGEFFSVNLKALKDNNTNPRSSLPTAFIDDEQITTQISICAETQFI
jgi:hypothetical protein